jgi:sigma-B regulation protein RsbU (phosphoserine phosphatase)
MEELTWKSASVDLQRGDALVLYTDGVVEAQNNVGEFFGDDRLKHVFADNNDASAETIQSQVMNRLTAFVGDEDQFDDITLLALKWE